MIYGSRRGEPGTLIQFDPDSDRSTGSARIADYQGMIVIGTRGRSSDEKSWSVGHEIAHVRLGHGIRMGMQPSEIITEEEDAWLLAKEWNPSIPDDLIEKSVDTYRMIRGRRVTSARLREHVKVLDFEDSDLAITYLEDIIADIQTPDTVKEVASAMLRRRLR